MNWTRERVERLKQLWADGLSASQVAARLGGLQHCADGGRSAVIGKVHRLGLASRQTTSPVGGLRHAGKNQPHKWHKPKPKPKNAGKSFSFQTSPNMVRQIEFTPEPLPMPAADDKARVSAKAVKDNQCRWPVGDPKDLAMRMDDPFHCGLQKVPGLPYCEGHARRAYMPPQPRDRRSRIPAESNVIPFKEKVAA